MNIDSTISTNSDDFIVYVQRRPKAVNTAFPLVEPGTIVAVVSAAVEYLSSKNEISWRESVGAKLDIIIAKLDTVIEELRSLKLWIQEQDLHEARRLLNEEIEARRKTVEDIVAGLGKPRSEMDAATKQRLIEQMDHIRVAVDRLSTWPSYGFVHFTGVISGLLTILLVMELVKSREGERNSFVRRLLEAYFKDSLDIDNQKSIAYARNYWALEAGIRRNTVANLSNREWLTNVTQVIGPGRGPNAPPDVRFDWLSHLTAGNPDGDLTCREARTGLSRSRPALDPFPGVGIFERDQVGQAQNSILSVLKQQQQVYFEAVKNERLTSGYMNEINGTIEKLGKVLTVS